MKIMQINVVYPNGSTGKIVKDIHDELIKINHESLVCFGRGAEVREDNIFKIAPEFIMKAQSFRAKTTGYTYGGCLFSTRNLINIIKNENPDVVHIHCINGYMVNVYKLLNYLKKNRIATVLTLHAEFMYTAGCGHALDCEKWKSGCGNCPQRKNGGRPASRVFDRSANEWQLMKKSFEGFDNLVVTSVSEWLNNRAKESPFFKGKELKVVLNGIDTENTFIPSEFENSKEELSLKDEKIVLHVTANFKDPLKGGRYVMEIAKRLENYNIKFIIVGPNSKIENLPDNVIALPKTENQKKLVELYSMADITLLTSLRETFSMVTAESLSCGTPVVGFKAGGPETIAIKDFGTFVEQGNVGMLEKVIIENLEMKNKFSDRIVKAAKSKYSKEQMFNQYFNIYNNLLEGRF